MTQCPEGLRVEPSPARTLPGFKSNGTVVAWDGNDHECDVEDVTDVVAIAAGNNHSLL